MGRVGSFQPEFETCERSQEIIKALQNQSSTSPWDLQQTLYREALCWVQEFKSPSFLLPALIKLFVESRVALKLPHVSFRRFELYLNHFSGLSDEENREVRGKIAGRYLPQDAYQVLFPVGLKGSIQGSHVVFAHKSPDLDTITASFFAWLDAFACRVGTGLHKWNIQIDIPIPQICHVFETWIAKGIFEILAIGEDQLQLRAEDLVQFPKDPSFTSQQVTLDDSLSDIRKKMGKDASITVLSDDASPIGVITKESIEDEKLASLSLRDFCNAEEGTWDACFEVVSILDHHRMDVTCATPPCSLTGDVQSCNVITYEESAKLNESFGLGPYSEKSLKSALQKSVLDIDASHADKNRLIKLLKLSKNLGSRYFVSKSRECTEYLLLLYAIFDDTDLLAKMTRRDLLCVANIVNQLKSFSIGEYIEVFSSDELRLDASVKASAKSLLQNEEMYSLYQSVYAFKEEELDRDLSFASKGEKNFFFSDTKIQKESARVGQAKVFPINVQRYLDLSPKIQDAWLQVSAAAYSKNSNLKLHILMISTLESAEDLFKGKAVVHEHSDALWFWVPDDKQARVQLCNFLESFNASTSVQEIEYLRFDFYGSKECFADWKEAVDKNLPKASFGEFQEIKDRNLAILSIPAGSITSRKSQITPFLP